MAEGNPTKEATPKRLRDARQRGEVALSRDLTAAALLALGVGMIGAQAHSIDTGFRQMVLKSLSAVGRSDLSPGILLGFLGDALLHAALMVAPILLIFTAVALLGPLAQIGPLLSATPLTPKLDRLNPAAGLKRVFLSMDTYVELLRAVVKISVAAAIVWVDVRAAFRQVLMLPTQPPQVAATLFYQAAYRCAIHTSMVFIGLAVLDVIYQRWRYRKKMRMTTEEVRREVKYQEGDPQHKAKRKKLHEEISSNMMLRDVRQATVVVINPTHVACALRYDPSRDGAPRLVGKGLDHVAQQIKEIAKEMDIPVVRDVTLAHALHGLDLQEQIPEELYETVGELLRWVEQVMRVQGQTPPWLDPDRRSRRGPDQQAPEDDQEGPA